MANEPGGTKFAQLITEIDLDRSKYDKKLDESVEAANLATVKIESAFKRLGVRTDESYEKQRLAITTFYKKIIDDANASANERAAAEQMLARKIEQINAKQYSAIRSMREAEIAAGKNYMDAHASMWNDMGVRSNAAINAQKKQVMDSYNTLAAQAQGNHSELIRLENAKNKKLESLNKEMVDAHGGSLASMQRALLRFYATYFIASQAIQALVTPFRAGINYLSQIETATLGIASSYATGGKYIENTTGKVLEGSAALRAAQKDSVAMVKELQVANLQTIATLDQLVVAYQQTLPVALSAGFTRSQAKDYTLAMVQAAGAIDPNLITSNQLGEETRSMLTGAINPRNSRIATVLGLTNRDIEMAKASVEGLFTFLMNKLRVYRTAGIEAQSTWAGLISNTQDIIKQVLGDVSEPIFIRIKALLTDISKSIYTVNSETNQITWNPEFLAKVEKAREAVEAFYRGLENTIKTAYSLTSAMLPLIGALMDFGMITSTIIVTGILTSISAWGSLAGGIAKATTAMEALSVVSKSVLPFLVFMATYKATTWIDNMLTGVKDSDLKESQYTKNQKKIIADLEAENIRWEQRERTKSAKEQEEAEKAAHELSRIIEHQFKEMVKSQSDFEKEYYKMTATREENDTIALRIKVAEWKKAGVDILRVEELFQLELSQIKLRANNEQLKFAEDLYKITQNEKYRREAEDVIKEINDQKQADWEKVRGYDDALILRNNADKEYYQRLDSLRAKDVTAEKEAFEDKESYLARFWRKAQEFSEESPLSDMAKGATLGPGGISGMPYLPGSIYQPFYDLVSGKTAADQAAVNASYAEGVKRNQEEAARLTEQALQAQKDYQDEQKRLWDEQIANNKKLNESMHDQNLSIRAWLSELTRGSLSPVQSYSSWGSEYERLKGLATNVTYSSTGEMLTGRGEDKTNFLSYAKEYMEFAKSYGSSGSYKSIYDTVVGDVNAMGDLASIFDILSASGLGQTESDLRKIVDAFNDMGVSTQDLNKYLEKYYTVSAPGAGGATVGLSNVLTGTEDPFANVQAAINTFTTTGLGSLDSTLKALSDKLKISYTPGVGTQAGSAIIAQYAPPSLTASWSYEQYSGAWTGGPNYRRYSPVVGTSAKGTVPIWYDNEWWMPPNYYDTYNQSINSAWLGTLTGRSLPGIPGYAGGGITSGLSTVGEIGPEWVVPTYEPQNKSFLKSVGADPETLGAAIGRYLQSSGGGSSDGKAIDNRIYIDGKEIIRVVTKGMKFDSDLISSTRKAVN